MKSLLKFLALLTAVVSALTVSAQSLMENLDRGVVAIRTSPTSTFVSWRFLGTDSPDTAFNLYRSTGGGAPVKLNATPLATVTNFTDNSTDASQSNAYTVRAVLYGVELPPSPAFTIAAGAAAQPYLNLPLQIPAGGTTPTGEAYTYSANDCSVADLDGDGQYEIIVKWDPSNSKDNAQSGYTGNTIMDAYKLDGTRLWRIDLGKNIRAGAHYSDFLVYDFDGDGKAELVCKTAPGSKDGTGAFIATTASRFMGTMPSFDPNVDYRNSAGYILKGYEFFTVFNGLTGAELASASFVVPRNGDVTSEDVSPWGDNYGNRVDRFLACVAYLDGHRPSFVLCRGYYTRAVLVAWDWRGGALTQRWIFDTGHTGTPSAIANWRGQGAHSLTVGDVDGDGKDEITYGAAAIDDNGAPLYSTLLGHGDALHMTDMDPTRPGQEVWMAHESPTSYGPNGLEFRDARTGALIFGVDGHGGDIGRGVAGDIDPRTKGYELWGSTGGLYDVKGNLVSNTRPSQVNFMVWWDGDLLRELLDNTTISKWNWLTNTSSALLGATGVASNNSTKATPNLSADILGDWREEVVWRTTDSSALRIYSTTIPTTYRFPTLMHDRQYRLAIAWQNVGYNQPPHPSFYLGDGMEYPIAQPNIVTNLSTLLGPPAPVLTAVTNDGGVVGDRLTNDPTLILSGTAQAGATVNISRLGIGAVGTALADSGGNWSFDYTGTTLPDGLNTFSFSATDAAANTGPTSTPYQLTIDTLAPAAPTIASVATNGAQLLISGTAEAGASVAVAVDGSIAAGSATADSTGAWSLLTAGSLTPANHGFTATATDAAGNTGPISPEVLANTSEAAPVITAIATDTGVLPTDGVTSDASLIFSGTATPGRTVNLIQVGMGVIGTTVADGSGNWSFDATSTPFADGAYVFAATVNVPGGGTSPFSPAFRVVVDAASPTVVSIVRQSPANFATAFDTVTFRVTFSEPVSGLVAGDFTPVFAGGLAGSISTITPVSSTVYDVVFSGLTGEGTVRLDLPLGGVVDTAGNPNAAYSAGEVYTRTFTGNAVWLQATSSGLWSDVNNWLYGIIGAGVGATADFNGLEIVDDTVVHLDSPRTIGNLIFGDSDPASLGNWIVDANGNPTNVLTLAVPSGAPTITVNNTSTTAVITAPLAGSAGLNKAGVGTLTINGAGTLNGALNVNGGTLKVATGGALLSGVANTAGGTQMLITGGSYTASGLVTVNAASGSLFEVSGGTVALNGGIRNSNNDAAIIRISGGNVTAANLTLQRGSYTTGAPSYTTGFIVTGGASTIGPIGIGTNNSSSAMSIEGGSLTATGAVTIGWQATSTRGGAVRVTNGVFNVTDTTDGLVLARVPSGGNTNNVAVATFSGGVSTIEKIKLGFNSAVTAGSATVTINGGALYLGSGGIERNGTSAFTSAITLTSGILGAKADWSSPATAPITLSSGSTLAIKAADAANAPHQITLGGVIGGSGTLNKTGAGALVLSAANTFTGPVALNTGTLAVSGSIAAGGAFNINNGGILAGTGTITRALTLNSGGAIAPADMGVVGALTATSLRWNGGGALAFELGASGSSDLLTLTGALTKGTTGSYVFAFSPGAGFAAGNSYTLASFGSTDFTAADFSTTGLPAGTAGVFTVNASTLAMNVIGTPVITSALTASGTYGQLFSYSIAGTYAPASFDATGLPPGLSIDASTGVISGTLGAAGVYNIGLKATNAAGTGLATLALDVAKAVVPIAVGAPGNNTIKRAYDGTPRTGVVTTVPAGLNATYTYNGSATAPKLPGTYAVVANIDDPNYTGTASGTLVITVTALVRHAPNIQGGIDGSHQLLNGESYALAGSAFIAGDALVPGLPAVQVNGSAMLVGVKDAEGSATPSSYTLTLNSSAGLRYVVRRVDPTAMPTVPVPPAPAGTRNVLLNAPGQSAGSFATVRNLTLSGSADPVAVPPGVYGAFTAGNGRAFILGVAGAAEPAVYQFQSLALNGGALQVVGPVIVRFAKGPTFNGGESGAVAHPEWLTLEIATGDFTLNNGAILHGDVIVPTGTASLNNNTTLNGHVSADRLTIVSTALLADPDL